MRVNIFTDPCLSEEYVDIHCQEKNRKISGIAEYIQKTDLELTGRIGSEIHRIFVNDILYFESVDKKCFACTEQNVFAIEYPLRYLAERYRPSGFTRISKSFIVNLYKIDYLKHDFEMRVFAHLINREVLVINRSYRKEFQTGLNQLKERMLGEHNEADQ